ncbi:DUF6879 family protein [Nocardia sp. NPDC056000]|uniref:DUF6879 family protein n=1 Tax=Nocardia sp. NPDC056000 TaxID=3345674 RepID=UPI0035DA4D8C
MEIWHSDRFPELMRAARKSAYHMEVRDEYGVASESEALRRFLAGEQPPAYDKDDWLDLISETTGRGVAVSRVRVVTEPHSDYQRWLLTVTDSNVAAGEDIRYLPRHRIDPGSIPADDWWLFDDEVVAFNLVDGNGRASGMGITTDRSIAEYCKEVKEHLFPLAIRFGEYASGDPVNKV